MDLGNCWDNGNSENWWKVYDVFFICPFLIFNIVNYIVTENGLIHLQTTNDKGKKKDN
jgi:hypothetical protein